jgi:DNA-binding NarL/FixJ family response regulator
VGSGRLKVVVAEDSLLVREGLRHVFDDEEDIVVAAETSDAASTIDAIERLEPDVLVTDIRMPPSNRTEGIAIAQAVRHTHPAMAVIVISQYADADYALSLFDDGHAARGYLLKERLSDGKQLVDAVRTVAAGGAVVDPQVVDTLLRAQEARSESPFATLTPREREVLGLVASGLSNAEIAKRLWITQRAVERHIGSIFSKLGLSNEGRLNRRVAATLAFLAEVPREAGSR